MSKHIVVEEGVIQCEHGGKVVLTSSVPNHVIGGKKPLYDIDLLNTPVSGCTYNISNGGQCTKVVAISSAVTESNVANQGKNYLLRVDGCKTDKGASLVLVDPGQTNTVMPAKSGGSSNPVTAKALEDAKLDTKENIREEKFRIYPLRKSNDQVKALRGGRDFQELHDFYSFNNGAYKSDKIVTYTEAYLYVTDNATKETTEYKVVNRGDIFNPQIHKVQYKDTSTNVLRRYIPYYKETGTLSFVYSNVKLSDADVKKFTPTLITVESAKSACTIHPKTFSKNIAVEQKTFVEEFETTAETVKEKSESRSYVSALLYLDDPIGEVEDLYNDYEFAYKLNYGYNKPLIDDIRVQNQYPYAVANMLDYLYVSTEDQNALDAHITKLKKQYTIMSDIVMKKFASQLTPEKKAALKLNLGKLLNPDFELAKEYLDEVKFISKSFFGEGYAFDLNVDNERYLYDPQGVYAGHKFKPLILNGKNYKQLQHHPLDALALIVFAFCYSKTYEAELSKFPKLVDAREKFYYLLKTAKPLPQINEKSIESVRNELKDQTELMSILNGDVDLLNEFESLGSLHKELSFSPDKVKSRNKAQDKGFTALYTEGTTHQFFSDDKVTSPNKVAKKLAAKLRSKPLADVLLSYKSIVDLADNEKCLDYYEFGLNLAYMLIAPRANSDYETDVLSPFNKGFEEINAFLVHLTKGMDGLTEEQAVTLHGLGIKEHYLKALFALIGHALINKEKNSVRLANATSLLNTLPIKVSKITPNFNNINDHNQAEDLKVKTQVEEWYEKLKNLNGISSKFPDFDEKLKDGAFGANAKSSSKYGGSKVKKDFATKWLSEQANKQAYKNLLSKTKIFAGVMTFMSIGEFFVKGKTDQLKFHNIVGLMNDTVSLTSALSKEGAKSSTKSVSSLSKFINKGVELDSTSLKLLVKLGAVGLIFNAANEMSELDKDDIDGKVSVFTKNAVVLAFMFTPGWAAVVGIAVVEVAWLFLKEYVVDTPLELYLRKNLFFDAKVYNDNLNFFSALFASEPPKKSKLAPVLLETLHSEGGDYLYNDDVSEAKDIKGFSTINEIRRFVSDNAIVNSKEIDLAMNNELNTLKQVLYGYKVEVSDDKIMKEKLPLDSIIYKTVLVIPQEVLDNNRHVLFYKDKKYEKVDTKTLGTNGKNRLFDTAKDISFTTIDALQDREDEKVAFIVVNDDITLKYKMQYHTRFENISYYSGNQGSTLFMVDNLESVGLTKADADHIRSLDEKGN